CISQPAPTASRDRSSPHQTPTARHTGGPRNVTLTVPRSTEKRGALYGDMPQSVRPAHFLARGWIGLQTQIRRTVRFAITENRRLASRLCPLVAVVLVSSSYLLNDPGGAAHPGLGRPTAAE